MFRLIRRLIGWALILPTLATFWSLASSTGVLNSVNQGFHVSVPSLHVPAVDSWLGYSAPTSLPQAATQVGSAVTDSTKAAISYLDNLVNGKTSTSANSKQPGSAYENKAAYTQALAVLPSIKIAKSGSMMDYARIKDFGTAWSDAYGDFPNWTKNGCDTRNDVLRRDLTSTTIKADTKGCTVLAGTLAEPYTGKTIHFVRASGANHDGGIQIDHVVALGNAWVSGASSWTAARRVAFANDPLVLMAVDGPANDKKGDDSYDEWKPSNKSYDCAYAAHQVAIKATYGLSMTRAEHDAIDSDLEACSK